MACVTTTFQIQSLCTSISSVHKIGPKSGKILGQSQKQTWFGLRKIEEGVSFKISRYWN